MNYIIKSNKLFNEDLPQSYCIIKPFYPCFEKKITNQETNDCIFVKKEVLSSENSFSSIYQGYLDKKILFEARSLYAESEDPSIYGWPVNRLPKIDRIHLTLASHSYKIQMIHDKQYEIYKNEQQILVISYKGILTGWKLSSSIDLPLNLVSIFFVLCQFLAIENELEII